MDWVRVFAQIPPEDQMAFLDYIQALASMTPAARRWAIFAASFAAP
jgi:hypothetical protein